MTMYDAYLINTPIVPNDQTIRKPERYIQSQNTAALRNFEISISFRMDLLLVLVLGVVSIFLYTKFRSMPDENMRIENLETMNTSQGSNSENLEFTNLKQTTNIAQLDISPIFSPEVQRWGVQIINWAKIYGIDPNIVATIMQIESCGDPLAVSPAGAQGLFQVMPFHFSPGENMLDPDTNANKGINYYAERLTQTAGNVYLAFAGYNGGHVAAGTSWNNWAAETQRYYQWSKGIYDDAKAGLSVSPTIEKWMQAGGASLCRQAASRIELQ